MTIRIQRVLRGWAILVNALFSVTSGAADGQCEKHPGVAASDELAYRWRGAYCEGRYYRPVARPDLVLASFTQSLETFDTAATEPLQLQWERPPGAGEARVVAESLNSRVYYRLDATVPATEVKLNWNTNVLRDLALGASDVGYIASVPYTLNGRQESLLVPLRLSQKSAPTFGYRLVLIPGNGVNRIFVSLARLDAKGGQVERLIDNRELGQPRYPSGQPISVPLPELKETTVQGIYRLVITARLASGGPAGVARLLLHQRSTQ